MRKRRKLAQFLADAPNEDPRRKNYEQRVRQALLTRSLTETDIAKTFGLDATEIAALLAEYQEAGARLVRHGERWHIDRYLAPDNAKHWKVTGKRGEPYRFGLVADTHIGSKHARLDVLDDLYDWFARENIQTVYHAGNWIEGEARFNKHELDDRAHGMQAQLDLFIEQYPQRPGITTQYVTGDDHEGWYSQREGVDIGRMLADTARIAGRKDLVSLGYKEAFVTLEHPKTRRHARLLIDHPGGGSAYAISYAAQKRIEAAQGGEKPAIWCFGHWHKHGYFQARNVHAILVPCTKDLDTFGRKKGLEYHIGGVIVEAYQDEGGAITELNPRFRMYFDRGYYNQQYSLSGPVAKR